MTTEFAVDAAEIHVDPAKLHVSKEVAVEMAGVNKW